MSRCYDVTTRRCCWVPCFSVLRSGTPSEQTLGAQGAGSFVRIRRKARQFQGIMTEAERAEAMQPKLHQPGAGVDQLCQRPARKCPVLS